MTNPYKQVILDKIEALEESIRQAQSFIDKKLQTQEELKSILESVEKGAKPVPKESEPPVAIEKESKGDWCPRCGSFPATFVTVQGGLQCASCSRMVWFDGTSKGVALLEKEAKESRICYIKPDVEEPVVEEVKSGQCPRCMEYPVDFAPVQGGLQCSYCWGLVWCDIDGTSVTFRAKNEEAKNV